MNDLQFRQLLDAFGLSWDGYRKVRKGVTKRIDRHMLRLGCRKISEYLSAIENSMQNRKECELLLTVSISRFFRDRQLWQALEQQILPELMTGSQKNLRVWSAGCACGEEAYSFNILWFRLQKSASAPSKMQITASDLNPAYLEKARAGIYASSSLKEVSPAIKNEYFSAKRKEKIFKVKPLLKQNITWELRHLLSEPPAGKFHIIFLRNNLLTYYHKRLQEKPFRQIIECLAPSGFLIIGAHEEAPFIPGGFRQHQNFSFVFRRTEAES